MYSDRQPSGCIDLKLLWTYFDHLIAYIKEFCKFSAFTELSITGKPGEALQYFGKPFVNVERVCIQPSDLDNISLTEMFPNMQRLEVFYSEATGFANVEQCFPNIKHLEILTKNIDEMEKTLEMIRLNPQLTSLSLPFTPDTTLMQRISESLPNLQDLKINYIEKLPLDGGDTVHLESVKRLEMQMGLYYVRKIPFSFHHLEELTLHTCYTLEYAQLKHHLGDFYSFIRENSSIQKLKIDSMERLNQFRLVDPLLLAREVFLAIQSSRSLIF